MEGEQGSLNGRREVIRGELRRNVMGQLKDQIYLEDEQLYEQIDTAIRQKGKETYLPLKERLWQRDNHIEQNVTEQHTTEQGGIYRKIRDFALDETGVGVIELVLILVGIFTP